MNEGKRYHRIIYIGGSDRAEKFISFHKNNSLLKNISFFFATSHHLYSYQEPNGLIPSDLWEHLPEEYLDHTLFIIGSGWNIQEKLKQEINLLFFNTSRNNSIVKEHLFDVLWYFNEWGEKKEELDILLPGKINRFALMEIE